MSDRPFKREFVVPEAIAESTAVPCYAFHSDVTANCARPRTASTEPVRSISTAGTYPVAWYAVIGLPSRLAVSDTGIYLMRLVSVAVCAALVASALASVRQAGYRLAAAGVALAVTPMVLFLAGSINPSGVEIAAAICLWASLAVVLGEPGAAADHRLWTRVAVGGAACAVARPASPLWVALIIVTLVGWVGPRRVVDLARCRAAWAAAGVVGAACAATLGWVVRFGTLEEIPGGGATGQGWLVNARIALRGTPQQLEMMIGNFGWLDTGPARLTLYLWLGGLAALLVLALVAAGPRRAAVLLGLVALIVVVPVLLQAPRAGTQGFPWQGRYTLPLVAGLPILAAMQVEAGGVLAARHLRRLSLVLLSLFVVGQLYAHVWATRRYTAGTTGRLNWLAAGGWDPPVPVWALFAAFAVALPAAAAWLHRLGQPAGVSPPG